MCNGRSVCEDSRNGLIDLAHVGGVPAIYIWPNALFRYSVQHSLGLKEKRHDVGKIFYRYQCA